MKIEDDQILDSILHPEAMYSHTELSGNNSIIPATEGVFAWYIRKLPAMLVPLNLHCNAEFALAYVDSSPQKPLKGALLAQGNMRRRILTDLTSDSSNSSIRKSLGGLLSSELSLERNQINQRNYNFGAGEVLLTSWIVDNVRVIWSETADPWKIRDSLIRKVLVPLSLSDKKSNPFFEVLTQIRSL